MNRQLFHALFLGFLFTFLPCAHMEGQAVGSIKPDNVAPKLSKASRTMNAMGALPSSSYGDWKTDAFWQGVQPDRGTAVMQPLSGWNVLDRLGDSRRKFDQYIMWGGHHGMDTFFFIRFDMNRVVTGVPNSINSDGYLNSGIYSQMCVNSDGPILSANATIKMFFNLSMGNNGAFGLGTPFNFSIVQFNDFALSGFDNNQGILGSPKGINLTVPTNWLRYPSMPTSGTPTPAWNMIVVWTDLCLIPDPLTGNYLIYNQVWNYLFDAELQYKAMAPILLVHGTNADHSTWGTPSGGSFDDFFGNTGLFRGISFSDIDLLPNGGIDGKFGNAPLLEQAVSKRLAMVGAKACHLIAHSKGGIDSRAMIYYHYGGNLNQNLAQDGHYEVLSLYTLDTPHRGTVLSDIIWNVRNLPSLVVDPAWPAIQTLVNWDFSLLHVPYSLQVDGKSAAPSQDALAVLQTSAMMTWNSDHSFNFAGRNSGNTNIMFYNTAADADWNVRNLTIDSTENYLSPYPTLFLATAAYQTLYSANQVTSYASTQPITVMAGDQQVTIYAPVTVLTVPSGQTGGNWNDLVVTINSAIYDGGTVFCPTDLNHLGSILLGNHSNIKSWTMASDIYEQIMNDWKLQ